MENTSARDKKLPVSESEDTENTKGKNRVNIINHEQITIKTTQNLKK